MIFPSICPLCQEVCKYNRQLLQYICNHDEENFYYSAFRGTKKRNHQCSEISIKTNTYILRLNFKSNYSHIVDLDLNESYIFSTIIPIDWNSFEIYYFEQKIAKIIQLNTFS